MRKTCVLVASGLLFFCCFIHGKENTIQHTRKKKHRRMIQKKKKTINDKIWKICTNTLIFRETKYLTQVHVKNVWQHCLVRVLEICLYDLGYHYVVQKVYRIRNSQVVDKRCINLMLQIRYQYHGFSPFFLCHETRDFTDSEPLIFCWYNNGI